MEASDDGSVHASDQLVRRAKSRIGTLLRRKWRLDSLLGVGGMAAVYSATHRNGTRAAVKVLHPELSLNPNVRSRFLREGYVANAVGHEGAVKVLDDDVADDGSLFLVTELLEGETLEERRLRSGGSLPETEVLQIADQLLDVLAAAHAKGIVHRDLKPENVFLTEAGRVKVLDFGIARLRELSTASAATRAGATLGTPAYMPPEQARGLWEEVEARSDLWACGATMFQLLTGRCVHEGRTPNEQLLSAMTKSAPACASLAPRVDPGVAKVVDRALAFERDERWPDARSMQQAVRNTYSERYGASIATAPMLAVAVGSDARTLPSAQDPPLSDTERPVASVGKALPRSKSRTRLAMAVATATASGLVLSAVVLVRSVLSGVHPNASAGTQAMPSQWGRTVEAATAEQSLVDVATPRAEVVETPHEESSAAQGAAVERAAGPYAGAAKAVGAKSSAPRPAASSPPPAKRDAPLAPPGYRGDVPY